MSISEELLRQAREEAETGNDQYSRGFVSDVITELLAARKELEAAKSLAKPEPVSLPDYSYAEVLNIAKLFVIKHCDDEMAPRTLKVIDEARAALFSAKSPADTPPLEKCPDCGADMIEVCSGLESMCRENRAGIDGQMRDALSGILNSYVNLVNSGDAGSWDCESEPEVIAARKALQDQATEVGE